MLAGWAGVLICLILLACIADSIDASSWLGICLVSQCFLMLSDTPADGYSVQLSRMERSDETGQILATGQRIRFTFAVLAGIIQMVLVNVSQIP
jgi:hypothetical protein